MNCRAWLSLLWPWYHCDVKGWQYKSPAEFKCSELSFSVCSEFQSPAEGLDRAGSCIFYRADIRLQLTIITIIHCVSANATTHHLLLKLLGACAKQHSVNSVSTSIKKYISNKLAFTSKWESHLVKWLFKKLGFLAVCGAESLQI